MRNEKPIVTLGDYSMSYCEPADRTAAVAAALAELGVCPEERVLIMLRESPGFAEAFAQHDPAKSGATASESAVASARPRRSRGRGTCPTGVGLVDQIPALADLDAEPPILVDGPQGFWAAALPLRQAEVSTGRQLRD